jgi:rhamnosyltransferase
MTVDIIIPTYKPDETLCLLLHKLQGQTFVVHRVIILNTEKALWKQAVAVYPIERVLQELPCEHEVIHIAKKDFEVYYDPGVLGESVIFGNVVI